MMQNIAQLIGIALFFGFLYFIAKAPADGIKVFLAMAWLLVILGGIASVIMTIIYGNPYPSIY